jgi:hypothetical protein
MEVVFVSEKLLELIEKYETKIVEIEEYIENNDPSVNELLGYNVRIEDYKSFIADLEFLLNSNQ